MNFELYEKLSDLLKAHQLDEAINLAEYELKQLDVSPFHNVLSRDLLHLKPMLLEYIDNFYKDASMFFEGGKSSFITSLIKPKNETKQALETIYCEMNGFAINYDLWYIELFAYNQKGDFDDLDWLSDFQYSSEKIMAITGFEDLQATYQDYMENEKWKDDKLKACSDICEFLIILRLQDLFRQTFIQANKLKRKWVQTPIYITAHDYEIIYRTTA
jgi:hypothetical protein